MHNITRFAAVLGCVSALAMAGCASNGAVTPMAGTTQQQAQQSFSGPDWHYVNGVLYHTPHYMATVKGAQSNHVPPPILLHYGNGPTLLAPKIYLTLWGYKTYGDANKVAKLLKSYIKNLGGSPLDNVETQYYMTVSGKNVNITNPSNQMGGIWKDQTNAVPANPSDSQVAAEALQAVAHFGYDANGSYVVATPHGHSTSGFGTQWCAYHSNTSSNGKYVSYTNLPYMPDAGASCGANFISPPSDETGADEGVTIVEGHEYAESITDPTPFNGWNSSYGEIGDLCAWTNVQNDPFHSKSYSAQPEYSNATQSCVHSY